MVICYDVVIVGVEYVWIGIVLRLIVIVGIVKEELEWILMVGGGLSNFRRNMDYGRYGFSCCFFEVERCIGYSRGYIDIFDCLGISIVLCDR